MKKVENAVVLTESEYDALISAAESNRKKRRLFKSITAYLFVTTQVMAIIWVTMSYGIAIYATTHLGQPFPIETLSESAVTSLLGVTALKVIENIFEHNDGGIWGTCNRNSPTETTRNADEEAAG